jgi:tetratricopeptide (TPR) repeat protein
MITPERQVKVLDFGIAKRVPLSADAVAGETQTVAEGTVAGVIVGTVAYMSPEQTRGEPVDARSDIFSLGCVLYQAATGRLPFQGASVLAVVHEIATARPSAPSSLNADLPPAFDRLIEKCLEKNPEQRPAKASQIAQELKLLSLRQHADSPRVQTGRTAVAVVPFRLRAGNPDDQFLSVALADAVIHRLASTGKLVVRPIASVMRYKDAENDGTRVAHDPSGGVVVQGAIQKMDERVNLPSGNSLVYELYFRAVERLALTDKFDNGIAIEMLERAIALDPNFSDAWGRLAQACTQIGMHLDPDPQWLERAERAIAKTLELDPVHCDALCARGQILWTPSRGFQNRAALRAVNASLKINPTRDTTRQFRSSILFHLGFYDQAERDLDDSLPTLSVVNRAMIANYRGDYQKAHDFFERAISLNPANVHANIFSAVPEILLGHFDASRARIRKARDLFPEEPDLTAQEGMILAREGDFSGAETKADQAIESGRSLTHTHHTWHDAAAVYAICGKPEKAIMQLRRCAETGLPNYLLFHRDPHLRSLHGHPGFQTLMTELRQEYDRFGEEFGLTAEESRA